MRTSVVGLGLVALLLAYAAPAPAQWLTIDARRVGMGGLLLGRSAALTRYNAAYRAVPADAARHGEPKVTIPIPLGLIQFFHDHPLSNLSHDPTFNPDSVGKFNPVVLLNTILTPPLYLEVKKAPTPTNDVVFGIGKDSLRANLGLLAQLVPQDQFGISGSSRPLDPGLDIKGVRVGVMGWLNDQVTLQLGDSLLGFLADSHPARHNTLYNVFVHGIVQGGFAPTVSYAGRIAGDNTTGFYLGGALHYYLGLGYFRTDGTAGDSTGNPLFGGPTPVKPTGQTFSQYSRVGNSLGHGVGGDIGAVWVSGPIEVGLGVNDIGATITWPDTRQDNGFYHSGVYPDSIYSQFVANHVTTKTKLPVSYVANLAYTVGMTTLGADVLNTGAGTQVHVGGEQRLGTFALRGGVARDQRKRIELGWGGGLRFGALGLDVGFWTHTNSLSNARAITMATSLSIY